MAKIDSQKILFIASANPEGLARVVQKRLGRGGLGFQASSTSHASDMSDTDALIQATTDDLIQYGFTPSFLAAFQIRGVLQPLAESDLLQICRMGHSPIESFRETFARLGVILEIAPRALAETAQQAFELRMGAKGIAAVLHQVLDPITLGLADNSPSVQRVILRELNAPPEVVLGPSVVTPQEVAQPATVEPKNAAHVRRLFPNGLPRRPARPSGGFSVARWANKNDLGEWIAA